MTTVIALLLGAAAAAAATGTPIYGVAIAGDGDSLRIRDTSIRLFGIDAPEFDQTCTRAGKPWACGADAAKQLSKLVTGQQVHCLPVGKDQHDRTLARCSTLGTDINRTMVEAGYAMAFRKYSTDYVAAEESAKRGKRGLWAGTFQKPSEYRAVPHQSSPAPARRTATRRSPQRQFASGDGCLIKGNHSRRGEWIYHLPGMPYYSRTRPEAMFCSEAEAQAAGYRRARTR